METFDKLTGNWKLHNLSFSPISIVDDATKERVAKDLEKTKDLGVIRVEILRGTCTVSTNQRAARSKLADTPKDLSEKSLKGKSISHGTSFTESQRAISAPKFSHFEKLPQDKGPLAQFFFYYRSRDSLKRELIIPRSPSPDPDMSGLSQEDINRLALETLRRNRDSESVKKEGSAVIKREFKEIIDLDDLEDQGSTRPSKAMKKNQDKEVVVDLTED